MINELKKEGGEFRIIGKEKASRTFFYKPSNAYFRITKKGRPIIGLDYTAEWETVMHEYVHFIDWKELKSGYMEEGMSELGARMRAADMFKNPQFIWRTEVNAVNEELKHVKFKLGSKKYIQRKVYPELVTAQRIFDQKVISKADADH